ncbi:arsenate reductase ArsC [Pseudomonas sp. v388]|uniref:arsenate reductase ArsC n=1 Tax=Pseudomonas sp. v388 TaxID=2479849 RepID=UPI000F7A62FA|nr:arsenate reductase ArsC [Pseudomonas sp. v388]RRV10151.1 arsenate reductase ArsC [Pseudomonas sp. v388]
MDHRLRVLFVCTTNAALSQMAEALLRHADPEHFEAYSAGIAPTAIDPRALAALQEIDIDDPALRSKSVDEFTGVPFDYIITLSEDPAQTFPVLNDVSEVLAWHFEDPVTSEKSNPFRNARIEISERVKIFVLVKLKKT